MILGVRLKVPAFPHRACHLISLSLSFPAYKTGMGLALVRVLWATSNGNIDSIGCNDKDNFWPLANEKSKAAWASGEV